MLQINLHQRFLQTIQHAIIFTSFMDHQEFLPMFRDKGERKFSEIAPLRTD